MKVLSLRSKDILVQVRFNLEFSFFLASRRWKSIRSGTQATVAFFDEGMSIAIRIGEIPRNSTRVKYVEPRSLVVKSSITIEKALGNKRTTKTLIVPTRLGHNYWLMIMVGKRPLPLWNYLNRVSLDSARPIRPKLQPRNGWYFILILQFSNVTHSL